MPSPTLQGGKGRDGGREREGQGGKEGRKAGRQKQTAGRNQVGISNYSSTCAGGSWCMDAYHGRNRSDQQCRSPNPPSPAHTAPHFTFISPSSSCCCLPLSILSYVCGFSNAALSLRLPLSLSDSLSLSLHMHLTSAHALYRIHCGLDIVREEPCYSL
jgi:hypothetical protein